MSAAPLLWQAAAVATGAALGALARWGTGLWLNPLWAGFPLGTLAVNALGGLLIGLSLASAQRDAPDVLRLFIITGLLGGFTTFSAFSAESLGLLQRGEPGLALAHSAAHVLGALACTVAGYSAARALGWR